MLDFPQPELDVVQPGALAIGRDVLPRLGQHLRRHVHADGPAGRPHFAAGNEHVEPAARAQVQHHFAGLERGERVGIAARETHVRTLGQRGQFFGAITDVLGQVFGRHRR